MPQNPDLVGLLPPSLMRGSGNFRANAERLIRELQSAVNTVRTDYVPLAGGTFSGEVQFNDQATFFNSFGNQGGFIYAYDVSGREVLMLEGGDTAFEARLQIYGANDTSAPDEMWAYADRFKVIDISGTIRFQLAEAGQVSGWWWPNGSDYIFYADDGNKSLYSRFDNLYLRDRVSNTTRFHIDGDSDMAFHSTAGSTVLLWDNSQDEWSFYRTINMQNNIIENLTLTSVVGLTFNAGAGTTYNHPTSGAAALAWENDFLRYRFGGTSTPAGLRLDNYDNVSIELHRNGDLWLAGRIKQLTGPYGGNTHIPHSDGTIYLTYNGQSASSGLVVREYNSPSYTTRAYLYSTWSEFYTDYGYIELGPANSSYGHIYTDRAYFYFNKNLLVAGSTVLHTGNTHSNSQHSTNYNYMTGSTTTSGANIYCSSPTDNSHLQANSSSEKLKLGISPHEPDGSVFNLKLMRFFPTEGDITSKGDFMLRAVYPWKQAGFHLEQAMETEPQYVNPDGRTMNATAIMAAMLGEMKVMKEEIRELQESR